MYLKGYSINLHVSSINPLLPRHHTTHRNQRDLLLFNWLLRVSDTYKLEKGGAGEEKCER